MELNCRNIPQALTEVGWRLSLSGVEEHSRNGPVVSFPEPLTLVIERPTERVLTCPSRDANPFFHVAEFVWMMAGRNDVEFVTLFNKRMSEYSDDGITFHGAYGHRWRKHFGCDQIDDVVYLLQREPDTRRAVLSMWDGEVDGNGAGRDYPCNTTVYFRNFEHGLDMAVCNRSNDIVWGMLGANAVHMTYLHELIARSVGRPVGRYRVFTHNAHTYLANPFSEHLLGLHASVDGYKRHGWQPYPLLQGEENHLDLFADCEKACDDPYVSQFQTRWMQEVYSPMRDAWFDRKEGGSDWLDCIGEIAAADWRTACREWCDRRPR